MKQLSEQGLVGLAGEAAVAIDNVRLFEAAQKEIEERRRVEGVLRELNANLEKEVKEAGRKRCASHKKWTQLVN